MRSSAQGLHKGTRVHVRGMGKRAKGAISREPDGKPFVTYRAEFNAGEYLVPLASVRRIEKPRF